MTLWDVAVVCHSAAFGMYYDIRFLVFGGWGLSGWIQATGVETRLCVVSPLQHDVQMEKIQGPTRYAPKYLRSS